MERNEISVHEVRVFCSMECGKWLTAREVSESSNVAGRTARAHLLKMVRLGLLDCAEVFPGHRYRLADKTDKRNVGYLNRIIRARAALGL